MNSQLVHDICKKHGVHFVNRSYGQATTSTVTLEQMQKIMEDAVQEFFHGALKDLDENKS